MSSSRATEKLPSVVLAPRRGADDEPSTLDRLLLSRPLHVACFIGAAVGGTLLELPMIMTVLGAAACLAGPPIAAAILFGRLFRGGKYRRSLHLAERLLAQTSSQGARAIWQLNHATCHIVMGNLERGKQLAGELDPQKLSPMAGWVLRCNLAALYIKLGDPEASLTVLAAGLETDLPATVRPYYFVNRAAANTMLERYPQALADLEKVLAEKPRNAVVASALSMKAHIRLETDDDPGKALAASFEAVKLLGSETRVQPQVLITHARLLLEATGDEAGSLDELARVIEFEPELGLYSRAELMYLLAGCFFRCGLIDEARRHLLAVADLPCPAFLRKRLVRLIDEVQSARPALPAASGDRAPTPDGPGRGEDVP